MTGSFRSPGISPPRLDGPFLRSQLFLEYSPPNMKELPIATSHNALGVSLPKRDLKNNPVPRVLPINYQAPPGNLRLSPSKNVPVGPVNAPIAMPPKGKYAAES